MPVPFNIATTTLRIFVPAVQTDDYSTTTGASGSGASGSTPDPITGTGTELTLSDGTVYDFTPPNVTWDEIENTTMDLNYRDYIRSCLITGGEMGFQVAYNPKFDITTVKGILCWFTITWNPVLGDDGLTPVEWRFPGIFKTYAPTLPLGDKAIADLTVRVRGDLEIFNAV